LAHLCGMKCKVLIGVFLFITANGASAQKSLNWEVDAYGEMYYAWDDLRNPRHERSGFLYNHTRSEELALNIGFVRARVTDSLWRASVGVMSGSYVQRNLASEPSGLRSIYEGVIGVRLGPVRNAWLEAGVFPSHIGYETIIGSDNPTLTRSLIAENSPYYESGVRLTWNSKSKQWNYFLGLLNGWQRMYQLDGRYPPALGWQIKYDPNARWSFNYSGYLGDTDAEEELAMRAFHDLYAVYTAPKGLRCVVSLDYGQQAEDNVFGTQRQWIGATGMVSLPVGKRWKLNGRLERYIDESEVLADNPFDASFDVAGYSLGAEYAITSHVLFRVEAKRMDSPDYVFLQDNETVTNVAHMFTAALSVRIP
jgi:hypothetical protein